jgi:hypothetical protein
MCEGLAIQPHITQRTFVLFVERTIATSAAERMRLGVALTGSGIRRCRMVQGHKVKERTRRRMYLSKSSKKAIISRWMSTQSFF